MQLHEHTLHGSGTFAGHILPGTLLLLWASCWLAELWRGRGARAGDAPLEVQPVVIAIKLALPLLGIAVEWPGSGWRPVDRVMNFQHVSMYAFFALSAVVDLLQRGGRVSRGATYVAFASAAVNAGALFLAHGVDGGVSATVHLILAATFFAAALFAVGEWLRPDLDLHWLRIGAVLTLGGWFYQIAWLLFRSGSDLADPLVQMRSQLLYSVQVLAAAVLLLLVRIARGPA